MHDLSLQLASWFAAHPYAATASACVGLAAIAYLSDVLGTRRLVSWIRRWAASSRVAWDDILTRHGVFSRLAHLIPAAVVYYGIHLVPGLGAGVRTLVANVAAASMMLLCVMAFSAALAAADDIYRRYPVSRERPIKGYIQVAQIIVYLIGGVLVLATLLQRSPLLFLSGFGAMTAVLLLVFRDTILSFVASIQIATNDMLRVGDWVEMPNYGADGDIVDIALHTVKVQNWDKTITTIPTHRFISESFKNWRGMSQSGGRRIKRAIPIDTSSIRFLTEEEVERFSRFALLAEYIAKKLEDVRQANAALTAEGKAEVNARRLTNVGTFRAYLRNYLLSYPRLRRDMTLLVRQLPPGPYGLPIEIYVFTNVTEWNAYEEIQADIFDHIFAIITEFDLRVFQNPGSADVQALVTEKEADGAERVT